MIFSIAPVLQVILVRPEAVITFRQGQGGLAIRIGGGVETGVSCTVENVNRQIGLRRAGAIQHRHGYVAEDRNADRRAGAGRNRTPIFHAAPVLQAVLITAKAIVAFQQVKAGLAIRIGSGAEVDIGCPIEGVHRHVPLRRVIFVKYSSVTYLSDSSIFGFSKSAIRNHLC